MIKIPSRPSKSPRQNHYLFEYSRYAVKRQALLIHLHNSNKSRALR